MDRIPAYQNRYSKDIELDLAVTMPGQKILTRIGEETTMWIRSTKAHKLGNITLGHEVDNSPIYLA